MAATSAHGVGRRSRRSGQLLRTRLRDGRLREQLVGFSKMTKTLHRKRQG